MMREEKSSSCFKRASTTAASLRTRTTPAPKEGDAVALASFLRAWTALSRPPDTAHRQQASTPARIRSSLISAHICSRRRRRSYSRRPVCRGAGNRTVDSFASSAQAPVARFARWGRRPSKSASSGHRGRGKLSCAGFFQKLFQARERTSPLSVAGAPHRGSCRRRTIVPVAPEGWSTSAVRLDDAH